MEWMKFEAGNDSSRGLDATMDRRGFRVSGRHRRSTERRWGGGVPIRGGDRVRSREWRFRGAVLVNSGQARGRCP